MEAEQNAASEVAIRFLDGPLAEQTITIERLVTMIGRDRQNDIVILDPRVSRSHARLRSEGDSWTIENLSQSSFVAIDQQHTGLGKLQHNSVVNLGEDIRFVFLLQTLETQPPSPPPATKLAISPSASPPVTPTVQAVAGLPVNIPLDASPSGTVLAAAPQSNKPTLMISSNIRSDVHIHPLDKPVLTIGRDPNNDIVIEEPTVSASRATCAGWKESGACTPAPFT